MHNMSLFLLVIVCTSCIYLLSLYHTTTDVRIHASHLTDAWYSHDKSILQTNISTYLTNAHTDFPVPTDNTIRAVIAPHAGYYYSGLCAATAYQALLHTTKRTKNSRITRVIILAPSHTTSFHGIALPDYDAYATPLGTVNVNNQALTALKKNNLFIECPQAHATEHAVEMQLPFLQSTIESFTIVPLVIGTMTPSDYASASHTLGQLWDASTLIVVSSDFIHQGTTYQYTPFTHQILDHVKLIDSQAIHAICSASPTEFTTLINKTHATICGQAPITLLITLINNNHPMTTSLSCYYTSVQAQKAHKKNETYDIRTLLQSMPDSLSQQSVSYAALIISEKKSPKEPLDTMFTEYEQQSLLMMARATLENYFTPTPNQKAEHLLYPLLSTAVCAPYGAFVTLKSATGTLRGCMGNIITDKPLYKTVYDMTLAAALHDPRFQPLTSAELSAITLEISILTKPHPVSSPNDIIVGKHGIVLKKLDSHNTISHMAVFLAHVAPEFHWNLVTTLEQLSIKAGLPKDDWQACTYEIFEELVITENSH